MARVIIRRLILSIASLTAFLLLVELAFAIANRVDPPKGGFCFYCREVSRAGHRILTAGPHGVAPQQPPSTVPPAGKRRFPERGMPEITPGGSRGYNRPGPPYLALYPGKHRSRMLTPSGQEIYDVHYTIDEYGRRVIPGQVERTRKRFLLLLGGSPTFGEGVEDDETVGYRISRLAPGYRVYNYGMHGYGLNEALLRMRDIDFPKEVPEEEGMAVFFFGGPHLDRVVGSMSLVASLGQRNVYSEKDERGGLDFFPSFQEARPWTTLLYNILWHSCFIQRYRIELPIRMTDAHREVISLLFSKMRELIQPRKNGAFRVVIMPEQNSGHLIIPILERLGIRYLNYEDWRLGYDDYPHVEPNRIWGDQLARDLGLTVDDRQK